MSPPIGGWAGGEPAPESRRPSEVIPARRLLRRLVAVVAEPTSPQQRLDKIVKMIAADLVAEVCSVYVQRAGDVLELFATEGLAREAVHRTRLRVGEGLVGTIAATGDVINTADAQSHPNFVYRPETREEIYHSMLGVPIVRSGRVVGVLTIQNTARRQYSEDEIDAMQIIASVLAEMFASGGIVDRERYGDLGGLVPERQRLEALRLVEGIAVGRAWLHAPRIEIDRLLADDPAAERARLEQAMAALRASLDRMLARADLASGEHREVLEAYRMFADDAGWLRRIREAIDTGLSAEAAVRRIQEQTRLRIGHAADPYLKERLLDLDDLANRLLLHLSGRSSAHDPAAVPEDCILIARNLSAAELIEYDRRRLKGIILEEGSKTAHVTIVARALGVPLVGRVSGAMALFEPGDPVAHRVAGGQHEDRHVVAGPADPPGDLEGESARGRRRLGPAGQSDPSGRRSGWRGRRRGRRLRSLAGHGLGSLRGRGLRLGAWFPDWGRLAGRIDRPSGLRAFVLHDRSFLRIARIADRLRGGAPDPPPTGVGAGSSVAPAYSRWAAT